MMIWIIAAVLTAICVVVLLNTLLRSRADHGPRSAFDLTVYKDQLTEIDRDLDRGLLNEVQASSARLEIERRMLAVAETNEASAGDAQPDGRGGANRWMAWFLAAALPGLALGLYLNLGSPNLPAVPYADRRALENEFQKAMSGDLQSEITHLEQRVQAQGLDAHAWLLLAGAYGDLNRFLDSANAYRRAIDLGAKEPQLYASLGEALVAASGGEVNTEARRAFAEAITLDSGNMKSLYYSGLALAQDGRLPAALRIWTNVLERSSPGTPWRPLLQQRIAQLETAIAARQASSGESEASEAAEGTAMPQPSADDVEAASRMSGEEQMAFIRSMVDRLAERLDSQPADLEGWLRLARAYSVLQEPTKARQALARASEAFAGQPQEPQAEAAIARARTELGL